MEKYVKNIKIKLKDMERHNVPSFPLDIVVFNLFFTKFDNPISIYYHNIYILIHASKVAN